MIENIIIALCSALVGTYCGTYFLSKREEAKMKKVRELAVKAVKVILNYKGTYDLANSEFNNVINISEKRTIVVALRKLGIPILAPINTKFDVRNVQFEHLPIDKDMLDDVILQINCGLCDHLFYEDPDKYFAENQRMYVVRSIAKRFMTDVMMHGVYDQEHERIIYSDAWKDFTWGEKKSVYVFTQQVATSALFNENGTPNLEKMEVVVNEIDLGIWDLYLNWIPENYENIMVGTTLSQKFIQLSQMQSENKGRKK